MEILKPGLSKVLPGLVELAKRAKLRPAITGSLEAAEASDTAEIVIDISEADRDKVERAISDQSRDYQRILAAAAINVDGAKFELPPLPLAGRIFQGAEFEEPGTPIWELWRRLLTRACDRDRVGEAHPAFPGIIASLSLDEVLILEKLFNLDQSERLGGGPLENFSSQQLGIIHPMMISAYNAHLGSLGLCTNTSKVNYLGAIGLAMKVDGVSISELSPFGALFSRAVIEPDGYEHR